jgi:hypothetical protein
MRQWPWPRIRPYLTFGEDDILQGLGEIGEILETEPPAVEQTFMFIINLRHPTSRRLSAINSFSLSETPHRPPRLYSVYIMYTVQQYTVYIYILQCTVCLYRNAVQQFNSVHMYVHCSKICSTMYIVHTYVHCSTIQYSCRLKLHVTVQKHPVTGHETFFYMTLNDCDILVTGNVN